MRVEKRKEGDAMDKMRICKICGAEISASAKSCPSCGAKNKPPVYKRIWFWLFIALVVIPEVGGIVGMGDTNSANLSDETVSSTEKVVSTKSRHLMAIAGWLPPLKWADRQLGIQNRPFP